MSEEQQPTGEQPAEEFRPITSQDELDKVLSRRLERERGKFADYDDLKAKAARLDEVTQAGKSEAQREKERADAAEQRAAKAESEALRSRIAVEYRLSQEDALTLQHVASEDGMRTVAERLKAAAEASRRPAPRVTPLASGSAQPPKGGEQGRAAAALRTLRQG